MAIALKFQHSALVKISLLKPNIKARAKVSNQTVFQKINAIAIENSQTLVKLMTNLSTDFSVYVTIMNNVTNNLDIVSQMNKYGTYRTHLRSIAVSVSPVRYGFGLFCHHRPMISRLVAIELCETTCLSA